MSVDAPAAHRRRISRTMMTALGVFALAAWAFGALVEEVFDRATMVRWDDRVESWMHAHASAGFTRAFRAITQLGSIGALLVVGLVAVWLWSRRDPLLLHVWLAGNVIGLLVQLALKLAVGRARPPWAEGALQLHATSFPSGHTMNAAVCYLLLAHILGDTLGWSRPRRAAAHLLAVLVVLLVAASRVYLGAHFPSDVAGGTAAGVAWVAGCVVALRLARRRKALLAS